MKIFITDEQKAELEHLHHTCRDKRECDRIKAVLLASEGWSSVMIAQALRLHEMTVNRHISDYLNHRKLKPDNGGSQSHLSETQTQELIAYLTANLLPTTQAVIHLVKEAWNISYTVPGMNKWLHHNGFSYKKPCGVPHKFDAEKQRQFIEYYENLKVTAKDEPILFLDAVHPTQGTKLGYGWMRKGEKKTVKTTGSRTRLNLLGALNLNAIGRTVFQEYQTLNDYNICCFFNEIRKSYPDYHQKIHLIVDGAGYNKAHLVKEWAYVSNIELHYLPPYSPNLNPIERLWKVMNEQVRNNRYFADKHEFRDKVFKFFTTTLPDIADSLTSRINDHFQVLKTAF
ncbi:MULTISPECIES: IS630 family transposase [unclassified Photorhabdus]|uniref:IS630 family transposase n=1 Tax=unclassified Photorhabdus TaxID=2620880 RepID=UPI000DCF2282|nr:MULTISPECIES: IS630 family transposase [unclassified Photorhabdus]RAW91779.1 IS630 family transposase [Photorhabdus sp. S9-53]RAW94647.1 IS630 family transposase [Photorhabdus sp. S8-52]RAX01232.1 IS630 family transposase [Photorhabdus sp. S10-54]